MHTQAQARNQFFLCSVEETLWAVIHAWCLGLRASESLTSHSVIAKHDLSASLSHWQSLSLSGTPSVSAFVQHSAASVVSLAIHLIASERIGVKRELKKLLS